MNTHLPADLEQFVEAKVRGGRFRSAVRWKTENTCPAVAARWHNGLIQKISTLRRQPTRCPLASED
jgi:hypothetical protein